MTRNGERRAWLEILKPEELDLHMASIGQAEANADIVRQMFAAFPLPAGSKLLIHGCGSCQMLDFLSLADLGDVVFTCADLSPAMLEVGKQRLEKVHHVKYSVVVDDIENSALRGRYEAVLLVLVLLHVDWRKSLENMIRLQPRRFYIIEQEQASGVSPVTVKEKLLPSLENYRAITEMTLVPRPDLTDFMKARGFAMSWRVTQPVPGDKAMAGYVFGR